MADIVEFKTKRQLILDDVLEALDDAKARAIKENCFAVGIAMVFDDDTTTTLWADTGGKSHGLLASVNILQHRLVRRFFDDQE